MNGNTNTITRFPATMATNQLHYLEGEGFVYSHRRIPKQTNNCVHIPSAFSAWRSSRG